MPQRFNPYTEWLGIPADSARPDHYALLNIRLFEADPQVISLAAGGQMAKVRGVRPGAWVVEWGRLLDELAEAKRCLTDPDQKSRYDQALRQQLGSMPPQADPHPADKGGWTPNPDGIAIQAGRNLLPPVAAAQASTVQDNTVQRSAAQERTAQEQSTAASHWSFPLPPLTAAVPPPVGAPPPLPSYSYFSLEALARLAMARGPVPTAGPMPMPGAVAGAMPVLTASALQSAIPPTETPNAARHPRTAIALCAAAILLLATFGTLRLTGRIGGDKSVASSAGSDAGGQPHTERGTNGPSDSGDGNPSEPPANGNAAQRPDAAGAGQSQANSRQKSATPGSAPSSRPPEKPVVLRFVPDAPQPAAPAVDPAQAARFRDTLASVRQNLGQRKLDAARRSADQAARLASNPRQQAAAERYNALVKYVGEFWGAVHDAIEGLKVTDEIEVGDTHWVVSETGPDSLTIHHARSSRHYALYELPPGLAVVLAERWFDAKKPANKVFLGAFYAVDPKCDPREAKRLWGEAAAAGVNVGNLMPLLEPEPAEPGPSSGPSPPPKDQLAPVPSERLVERAERSIRDEFDDAYFAADSEGQRLELANKLLDAANATDDPMRRFVLWREARDQAIQAGHAAKMSAVVDRMALQFRIDALDMKTDLLVKNPPANLAAARETTRVAVKLVDAAIAAKRLGLASRLAQLAVEAAGQSQNAKLRAQAAERSERVDALLKSAPSE